MKFAKERGLFRIKLTIKKFNLIKKKEIILIYVK